MNYQKSKIYKITSSQTDKIYIGSTIKTLSVRFAKHKTDYNRFINGKQNYVTSFEIL